MQLRPPRVDARGVPPVARGSPRSDVDPRFWNEVRGGPHGCLKRAVVDVEVLKGLGVTPPASIEHMLVVQVNGTRRGRSYCPCRSAVVFVRVVVLRRSRRLFGPQGHTSPRPRLSRVREVTALGRRRAAGAECRPPVAGPVGPPVEVRSTSTWSAAEAAVVEHQCFALRPNRERRPRAPLPAGPLLQRTQHRFVTDR